MYRLHALLQVARISWKLVQGLKEQPRVDHYEATVNGREFDKMHIASKGQGGWLQSGNGPLLSSITTLSISYHPMAILVSQPLSTWAPHAFQAPRGAAHNVHACVAGPVRIISSIITISIHISLSSAAIVH
jgi:hypothetical protein